jgi:pheromone shutdown protein TraB
MTYKARKAVEAFNQMVCREETKAVMARADDLRAAQLQADAARYRWLRDSSLGQWEHPIVVSQSRTPYGMRYVGPLMGAELDAAIDLARKTEPPK